jgi:DNA-binding GntR family transcriptional regulator
MKLTRLPKEDARNEGYDETDHTQRAYNGIRNMMFHNEIAPGQKISYRDLASRLGMSPTPVIQALNRLEWQGLVRRERNRGYYSEPISVKQVEEIYDLRVTIEVSLIPDIIKRLTPEHLKRLGDALTAYQSASKEVYLNERLLKDMEYHVTLASLSGCQTHLHVLRYLFDLLYLRNRGSVLFSIPTETVDKEHIQIFEAISAKNVKRTQAILNKHIVNKKLLVVEGLTRIMEEKSTRRI